MNNGLRWFRASNDRATFGFAIEDGRVVECAPYGRKWLLGRNKARARQALRSRGFRVVELPLTDAERATLAALREVGARPLV